VPDVCVTSLPEPDEQVFTEAPYICVEILSPEDTFPKLQERFDDYLAMGIPNVWVLDPASRRGWRITAEGHLEARDGVLKTHDGRIAMPIADLYAALD
jgi:Uma2 family endonuclease